MFNQPYRKRTQAGNVLFLILIAVALFAALSYVVTQSTRSGGGSTEREKNILSSAQMTQYPTALRTALIRMVLGGAAIEQIKFDAPGNFGAVSSRLLVFHPQGGGALYQEAPSELSSDGNTLEWFYNANFDVPGIGIDGGGGNDIVAFLPGISQGVCQQVNEELGVDKGNCTVDPGGNVPQIDTAVTMEKIKENMVATPVYAFPTTNQQDMQCDAGTAFMRKASGCFYHLGDKKYVFYSVLLER